MSRIESKTYVAQNWPWRDPPAWVASASVAASSSVYIWVEKLEILPRIDELDRSVPCQYSGRLTKEISSSG